MSKEYPPPIISTQPGSWANTTVLNRWPETVRKVLTENDFSKEIQDNLTTLINDIPDHPIRHLKDLEAPDKEEWISYITPFEDMNWLEIPWLFGEHYFFRRIIEAVDYFKLGLDPFRSQKQAGLEQNFEDIQEFAAYLNGLEIGRGAEVLRGVIYFSVWGNQADLSLWTADSVDNPKHSSQQDLKAHLLADDTNRILKIFKKNDPTRSRVDIMLDNAGFELVCDLGLADTFLRKKLASKVVLHTKKHPTFVSDVIEFDINNTVDFLLNSTDKNAVSLAKRLNEYLEEGRMVVLDHYFWNSPLEMWKLPPELWEDLKKSDLIISKGGANYRRLLGDREWDFTLPFHQVVDYLPVPLAALRTSKAELAVGLDLDQIREVYNRDPDWLVNGKWGVVHFAPGINKAHT